MVRIYWNSPEHRLIIRLNEQCLGAFWVATVQLAVNAYIVPDGAMAHEIRLGTDSWARFLVLEY